MNAILLAGAWSSFVVLIAWQYRPAPVRVRALVATTPIPISRYRSRTFVNLAVVEKLGTALLRLLRRPIGLDSVRESEKARRIGWTVLGVGVSFFLFPPLAAVLIFASFALPSLRKRSEQRRRTAALLRHLPEVVDLLLLAAGAGLNVSLSVSAVARRGPGPLANELARAVKEATLGRRLAEALEDVVDRTDETIRPLIAALVAAERYGAPLHDNLVRLADEVRAQRRRRAEEAARRVPIKLLFPLVSCILPAFGLLTMAPLIASALKALRL